MVYNTDRFLRALKIIKFDRKKGKVENNKCTIWEALQCYENKVDDGANLIEQSKTLLNQISKKTTSQYNSFDNYRLKIIDDMTNLIIKQLAVFELVEREKKVLSDASDIVNNLLIKIVSKYNIIIKEPSIYDADIDEENRDYFVISDADKKISIISEDFDCERDDIGVKEGINASNAFKPITVKNPESNKKDLSKFMIWKRVFKKQTNKDSKTIDSDEEMELYNLVETLIYGSGKLKLLLKGLEWIERDAGGVYSRSSWSLNEELKKICEITF